MKGKIEFRGKARNILCNGAETLLGKEEWIDVKGYEEYYQVSSLGQLKSKDRIIYTKGCVKKSIKRSKPLVLNTTNGGYKFYVFVKDKKRKMLLIHRVVYESFIGKIESKMVIDHINNIRHDNRLANLQKITQSDNTIKSINRGLPTGVYQTKGGYIARIYNNGKTLNLGTYKTIEEAAKTYKQKKKWLKE